MEATIQKSYEQQCYEDVLNLCINNKDFDRLLNEINKFNPLKILGIQEYEIRHSNMLAWLIDPKAHHGLGDTLFRKILLEVLREGEVDGSDDILTVNDVLTSNYFDLDVMREWNNIDVLAVSRTNKMVFVVENKIHAGESEHQLTKYYNIISKKYQGYKKVFVFLTKDNTEPAGCKYYIPFNHANIIKIIKDVIQIKSGYINPNVLVFMQQYIEVMEEILMTNEQISSLCRELYRQHKNAIDLIIEYGKPRIPTDEMNRFHKETDTINWSASNSKTNTNYGFIPQKWGNIVPATNLYTSDKYLVNCFIHFSDMSNDKNKRILMRLYIGYFPDAAQRKLFMEKANAELLDKGIIGKKLSSQTQSTVKSVYIPLEDVDLEDYSVIVDKLIDTYKTKFRDVIGVMDSVIHEFFIDNPNHIRAQ